MRTSEGIQALVTFNHPCCRWGVGKPWRPVNASRGGCRGDASAWIVAKQGLPWFRDPDAADKIHQVQQRRTPALEV